MATKYPWGEEGNHRSRYGHEPSELEDKMWQTKQTSRAYTQRRDFKPTSCDDEDNCDDDDGDTASVASTAPSTTAPSIDTLPGVVMNLIDYGYEFCCPFEFVGCESSFHPTKLDAYISHTITHFFDHRPPPTTICIFCPKIFENPEDRVESWKERMRHIADHYRRLERFEHSGPDFFVIEYMRQKKIISGDDYKWATRHTERHDCDGLVDFGYKTAEMRRKEGKSIEEPYDLEKEDRHRRRQRSSKSKCKGKGWNESYPSSQGRHKPVYDLKKEDRQIQRETGSKAKGLGLGGVSLNSHKSLLERYLYTVLRSSSTASMMKELVEGQPAAEPVLAQGNHAHALDAENLLPPINLQTPKIASALFKPKVLVTLNGEPSLSSCSQLESSSGTQPVFRVSLEEDRPTALPPQPQISSNPSPLAVSDKSEIRPIPELQSKSSSSRSNTLTSFTEDSDWGEDEITESLQDLNFSDFSDFSAFARQGMSSDHQLEDTLTQRVFSPMQQQLIDKIMKEFWAIFDQEPEALLNDSRVTNPAGAEGNQCNNSERTCQGGGDSTTKNSSTSSSIEKTNGAQKGTQSRLGRHKRNGEDDESQNNEDERNPKRPCFSSNPQIQDDSTKFACPYRKRDPRKYNVQHRRPCALTPLDTIARVKAHLYRHHRIFPCQRCKDLFKDQEAVNLHLKRQEGCELRDIEHADGVTAELVEKLRSKRKAQRNQTEAGKWQDIYKLLFPNEMVPSAYFEVVQEDIVQSPDSGDLADYEEYCRRELPRTFRAALEEIVQTESQPIEESIRNRMMEVIRDCQDLVFSKYRSSAEAAADIPSTISISSDSSSMPRQVTRTEVSRLVYSTPENFLECTTPLFFQPPPPQSHLRSLLEVSNTRSAVFRLLDSWHPPNSGHICSSVTENADPSSSSFDSVDNHTSPPSSLCQSLSTSGLVSGNLKSASNMDKDLGETNPSNGAVEELHETALFDSSWWESDLHLSDETMWNLYTGNTGAEDPFGPRDADCSDSFIFRTPPDPSLEQEAQITRTN